MSQKKRRSRQDLIREQQKSIFVGRVEQLAVFEYNLAHLQRDEDGFAYPQSFLFNIWGQGGVGKTTLLHQFEAIIRGKRGIVGQVDEGITTVPEVLGRFAQQFAEQGKTLSKFSERYKVYRQKREELETDPEAPKGFSAFAGKTLARAGVSLSRQIPVAGAAIDFIGEDKLLDAAGEWAAYVTRKLKNKDEIQLVNEPLDILTPLFLEDLEGITQQQIVLLFDTYEYTGPMLEHWLLNILAGRYGELPLNCVWVIAGRDQLNANVWSGYEPVQFSLEPFTFEEAQQFLQRKGVTNPKVVEMILDVSGQLPLLLAILAESSPNDPTHVGEVSSKAVERFLKWVEDPVKRQLALDTALSQSFNRDVVAHLVENESEEELFNWLKGMPFVRERSDGWAYHDVVRPQMLRYQRRQSEKQWTDKHELLAQYYESCCQRLGLDENARYVDETWQVYKLRGLYHQLCAHPQKKLPLVFNQSISALSLNPNFAQQLGAMILQVGQELHIGKIQSLGTYLVEGMKAYIENDYAKAVAKFTILKEAEDLESTRDILEHLACIIELLQDLSILQKELDECVRAGEWIDERSEQWSQEATQALMQEYPKLLLPSEQERAFLREVSSYLAWMRESLSVYGAPSPSSIYEHIQETTFDSPEPYVFVLKHLQNQHDWEALTSSQARYLEMMFDEAIKRLSQDFSDGSNNFQ